MHQEHPGWALSDRFDAVWTWVERLGWLGGLVMGAAPPIGRFVGGVEALYYVIPLSLFGLFLLWVWARRLYRRRDSEMLPNTRPVKSEYIKETVRLVDLIEPDGVIHGTTFTDCVLLGPAVLCGAGGHFSSFDPEMFASSEEAMFIVLPPGGKRPDGSIGFRNCIFKHCRLHNISFASSAENIEQMRSQFRTAQINP